MAKMIVVIDESGQVVAASFSETTSQSDIATGFAPLEGQQVLEVEIPEHLRTLSNEGQLRAALDHRVPPQATHLVPSPRAKKGGN